ncbi:MAG: type II and III secretion system protein family protein, partial [Methylocella sp.]
VDVEVKIDTSSLGSKIREGSGGNRSPDTDDFGKIVLSVNAAESQTVERAMSVAAGLAPAGVVNALKVTTPQQVMLKVRFVEANREAARNLGVRWEFFKQNGNLAGVVGTRQGSRLIPANPAFPSSTTFPQINPNTGVSNAVFDVVGGAGAVGSPFATIITQIVNSKFGSLDAVLSALEEQKVIRNLAEPNLIALSGETASFLAGGSYPIPVVSSSGAGGVPTITIQYQDFGVKLNFTPTVLSRGVISLKLNPEVSQIDNAIGVTLPGGGFVPGLDVRRAQTTVELRDGQSFAIAGMLQATSSRTLDQLPWLGTVPILGALFRSSEFQQNETELVVLVTPYLIKPMPPGKQLKTPLDSSLAGNDVDFFLNGRPEVAKTPPAFVNGQGQVQSLAGAIAPGAPGIPPLAAVPVAAVQVPPAVEPVPPGDGALRYDPATGYFIDPLARGGAQ